MAINSQVQAPWGEYLPRIGRMTVEQFEQFPSAGGWYFELHEGRVISLPGPGTEHAQIQARLFLTLGVYLHTNGLGLLMGTGCYNLPQPNNTEEVLCPDLSYVLTARMATMPKRGSFLVGAPDLVIEIASSSDTHPDLAAKIGDYLQAGVALIWVLWPTSRTIEIWRPTTPSQPTTILQESDLLDGEAIVPSFQCPVRDLFAL